MIRIPVPFVPCRIGRRVELEVQINDPRVSQLHAEIFDESNQLWLRDLESTNGTFLNNQKVTEPVPLQEGDVIRFAATEFRFKTRDDDPFHFAMDKTAILAHDSIGKQLFGHRDFVQLLNLGAVVPYFQPIIRLGADTLIGYEVLGRGNYPGLPNSPKELFQMARTYGMESNLSELFRSVGIRAGAKLDHGLLLFVNMHPAEVGSAQLLRSLQDLREQYPEVMVVLELHESAMTDLSRVRELREGLFSLDIGLAYDDFGAGQARLIELAEVPPDYIKFDVGLIRQIHEAGAARHQLVQSLVRISKDMGVETLAEGVELQQEREVCEQMGFDLAQGYIFGRPVPADDVVG